VDKLTIAPFIPGGNGGFFQIWGQPEKIQAKINKKITIFLRYLVFPNLGLDIISWFAILKIITPLEQSRGHFLIPKSA